MRQSSRAGRGLQPCGLPLPRLIGTASPRVGDGARRLPAPLAGAGIVAAAAAVLLAAGLLVGRYPFAADRTLLVGLRAAGEAAWWPRVAADITALGGGVVLTLVVAVAAGWLLSRRLWLTALATVLASLSGSLAVNAVKAGIGRARPDLVPRLVEVGQASFPSGHAANSAVVYLTLAALAAQVTPAAATRRYLLVVAILLVGAIGTSRVYLGVHWPSDVLAGWSFGTLWAIGWWRATAWTRGAIGGER